MIFTRLPAVETKDSWVPNEIADTLISFDSVTEHYELILQDSEKEG